MGKGRAPCCDKSKVRTGPWSPAEDLRLIDFILKNGHNNWRALPKQAGLLRCGKSCRLRWVNYLRPDVKRGNFTPQEEETIIKLHNSIGKKWSKIASYFPGRTDNEIKNVWNTHLKKRLIREDGHQTQGNNSKMGDILFSSVEEANKSPDESLKLISIHDHIDEPKHTAVSDDMSNFGNFSPEKALGFLESEATYPRDGYLDDDKFEIPPDLDVDLWELLNSLEPLPMAENGGEQETDILVNLEVEREGEAAVSTCLRSLENELGLTSECDVNHLAMDQHWVAPSILQYQQMNFEPEISTTFDYSSIWPCSL